MNELQQEVIERGRMLGLSMKTIKRMMDAETFSEPVSLPSMKERATMNENHHLQKSHGRFYFKLIKNGKCISHPLSNDIEEAKRMRDDYLKQYEYR
jgi:DNA-binding transcriptional MerR regulator